jgi:hypothetical protein
VIVAAPQFDMVQMAGTNLLVSGLGGQPNAWYRLLGSSNLALPLNQWLPILSNQFGPAGEFDCAIPVNGASPAGFIRLTSP